jgi:hypothetical protein
LTTLIIAFGLLCVAGCRSTDQSTASPEGSGNLLGLDVSPGSQAGGGSGPREEKVPVKCLTDPGDPDCEEPLGYVRTDDGGFEFGEVCSRRVCSGRGECVLDPDGAVACECEEGAKGLNCDKTPRK